MPLEKWERMAQGANFLISLEILLYYVYIYITLIKIKIH